MSDEIKNRLICATRQFRHNSDNSPDVFNPAEGFVCAYDRKEVDGLIADLQSELTAAKAENEALRGRLDSYICAVSTMDIVTQKAYVSGAATVHNIKQIVAEAAEKGGDDEPA